MEKQMEMDKAQFAEQLKNLVELGMQPYSSVSRNSARLETG